MKNLLIISFCFFSLISCVATHNGVVSSSSPSNPVIYVDIAYGVSQTNKVIGLGGISTDALVYEAKRNLFKNRPLNHNEQYVNFTTDFKRTYIPFYIQTKVTLAADVVIFQTDTTSQMYSDIYKMKLMNNPETVDLFNVGDSIIDENEIKGVIISIENSKKARILYETNNNKIRTKLMSISRIYTTNKEYEGYKVGNRYIYDQLSRNNSLDGQTSGKIIALGVNTLLIRENDGSLTTVNYKD